MKGANRTELPEELTYYEHFQRPGLEFLSIKSRESR